MKTKPTATSDECQSMTAEITPHSRPTDWLILSTLHKSSSKTAAERIAAADLDRPLRITGQMMMDGSHRPCTPGHPQSPKRISLWERTFGASTHDVSGRHPRFTTIAQSRIHREMTKRGSLTLCALLLLPGLLFAADIVAFPSGELTLHGMLYKPQGTGPFPAVVYNHGSAPGMVSKQAFDALGPVFASHGWVFFGPYRRGQGLSASAGPYIGDQIAAAEKSGGITAGAAVLVRVLETDHLNDQLAALAWLRKQAFVQPDHIAVAGNSFGGIETVLGAERGHYCAAIDSAGGAQSWAEAPELRSLMTRSVRSAHVPIFFFQAANDYDLSPTYTLSAAMKDASKPYQMKIYPAYGNSPSDGHTFGYFGSSVWADDVFQFLNQHCAKS